MTPFSSLPRDMLYIVYPLDNRIFFLKKKIKSILVFQINQRTICQTTSNLCALDSTHIEVYDACKDEMFLTKVTPCTPQREHQAIYETIIGHRPPPNFLLPIT